MSVVDGLILAHLERRLHRLEAQIDPARFDPGLLLRSDRLQALVDGFQAVLADEGADA